MDNLVFRMLIEKMADLLPVLVESEGIERHETVDPPTQSFYLVFIGSSLLAMHCEIKLHSTTVDIAVVVHHHGLSSSSIEDGEKHEHSKRSLLRFCLHDLFDILKVSVPL